VISRGWVERVRSEMAELPRVMAERFVTQYGLPEYDATTLTQSKAMAAYFEETAKASGQAKLASNWIMGEVSALLNKQQIEITDAVVPSAIVLAKLISKIVNGAISNASGKTLFQEICLSTGLNHLDEARINLTLDEMIEAKGLRQMNDTGALEAIIDEVLAANPKNVEEFKAGNVKALNGLVGPIMKASKGKANPAQVNALLLKKLG